MTFLENVKFLEKLAELGAEDRLIDQTLGELLLYAEEKERKELEGIATKLRSFEEQFRIDSELFYERFHTEIPTFPHYVHRGTAEDAGSSEPMTIMDVIAFLENEIRWDEGVRRRET